MDGFIDLITDYIYAENKDLWWQIKAEIDYLDYTEKSIITTFLKNIAEKDINISDDLKSAMNDIILVLNKDALLIY